ncbi:Putative ribonuclease H protein At1g65750 [Linum perenne]
MAEEGLCPRCKAGDETILHVLRDCPFARKVWTRLGFVNSSPFRHIICSSEWVSHVLSHTKSLQIGIGCWFLWKARNEWLFTGNNQTATALVYRIEGWVLQVNSAKCQQDSIGVRKQTYVQRDIAWGPGEAGRVILNTDGSVYPGDGSAAAGGLIRNSDGRYLLAFCANLGKASIMKAELRGAMEGLRLAWENNFRKVDVRVDSEAVISLITGKDNPMHQHAREVNFIREFLNRDWDVTISHIYREGNFAADYLASIGHSNTRGVHLISLPDCNLS